MKTHFFSFAVLTMILSAPGITEPAVQDQVNATVISQSSSSGFSFFRIHRQGKGVTANWGVSSGAGVMCFVVQKTYEDPTDPYAVWEDAGLVDCNGSRSYKYTDNNVFPGSVTYRISSLLSNGASQQSPNATIKIVSR